MWYGLYGINVGALAREPRTLPAVARAVEDVGWESVWAGEHYALPDPAVPTSPAPPGTPMLDPFVALSVAAAHTSTLLVGTSVVVVPLQHPLAVAKRVASLDVLSGGRFLFGVGVGYLAPEFEAFGVPLADRAARTEDYLAAMRTVWAGGTAHHDGPYARFDNVRAEPRPVNDGGPPIHFGGHVPAVYRRAVSTGHGWYGWSLLPDDLRPCLAGLRAAADAHDRPASLGRLEITVAPPQGTPLDEALLDAYEELGVDRLTVLPPNHAHREPDGLVHWVTETAAAIGH